MALKSERIARLKGDKCDGHNKTSSVDFLPSELKWEMQEMK